VSETPGFEAQFPKIAIERTPRARANNATGTSFPGAHAKAPALAPGQVEDG